MDRPAEGQAAGASSSVVDEIHLFRCQLFERIREIHLILAAVPLPRSNTRETSYADVFNTQVLASQPLVRSRVA